MAHINDGWLAGLCNCGEGAVREDSGEEAGDKMHNSWHRKVQTGTCIFTQSVSSRTIWLIFTQSRLFSNNPFSILQYRKVQHLIFTQPITLREIACPSSLSQHLSRWRRKNVRGLRWKSAKRWRIKSARLLTRRCARQRRSRSVRRWRRRCASMWRRRSAQWRRRRSAQWRRRSSAGLRPQNNANRCKIIQKMLVLLWYSGIVIFWQYSSGSIMALHFGEKEGWDNWAPSSGNRWFAKVQNAQTLIAWKLAKPFKRCLHIFVNLVLWYSGILETRKRAVVLCTILCTWFETTEQCKQMVCKTPEQTKFDCIKGWRVQKVLLQKYFCHDCHHHDYH